MGAGSVFGALRLFIVRSWIAAVSSDFLVLASLALGYFLFVRVHMPKVLRTFLELRRLRSLGAALGTHKRRLYSLCDVYEVCPEVCASAAAVFPL